VFVPRTSSTLLATWFWQTEGRSAERVILGVRPSEFILMESLSPSRRVFIGSHSLPPPSGRLISPSAVTPCARAASAASPPQAGAAAPPRTRAAAPPWAWRAGRRYLLPPYFLDGSLDAMHLL
jgi:hypothetical protein